MAIAGVGTVLSRMEGSVYVAIAEVNNISGPGMTRDTIDTTALDTTGGYRTFITGFRDSGELTFQLHFTRVGYELMLTDFESDTAKNYQIALPDADNTEISFSGLVTGMPLTIPADDKVTVDVTIKISGAPSVASA